MVICEIWEGRQSLKRRGVGVLLGFLGMKECVYRVEVQRGVCVCL